MVIEVVEGSGHSDRGDRGVGDPDRGDRSCVLWWLSVNRNQNLGILRFQPLERTRS